MKWYWHGMINDYFFGVFFLQRTGKVRVSWTNIIMQLTDCLQPRDGTEEPQMKWCDAERLSGFISEESRDKVTFTAPNWSWSTEGNSVSICYDLPLPGLYLVIYYVFSEWAACREEVKEKITKCILKLSFFPFKNKTVCFFFYPQLVFQQTLFLLFFSKGNVLVA